MTTRPIHIPTTSTVKTAAMKLSRMTATWTMFTTATVTHPTAITTTSTDPDAYSFENALAPSFAEDVRAFSYVGADLGVREFDGLLPCRLTFTESRLTEIEHR